MPTAPHFYSARIWADDTRFTPQSRAVSGRKTLAITLLPSELGALGARRVPRERVRGLSALSVKVGHRDYRRETSTAAASSSERPTPAGAVPVRCPHLGGFRLRGSCVYSRTHFLSRRRQTTSLFSDESKGRRIHTGRRRLRTSPRRRPRRLPCYDHPALPRVIGGL